MSVDPDTTKRCLHFILDTPEFLLDQGPTSCKYAFFAPVMGIPL